MEDKNLSLFTTVVRMLTNWIFCVLTCDFNELHLFCSIPNRLMTRDNCPEIVILSEPDQTTIWLVHELQNKDKQCTPRDRNRPTITTVVSTTLGRNRHANAPGKLASSKRIGVGGGLPPLTPRNC